MLTRKSIALLISLLAMLLAMMTGAAIYAQHKVGRYESSTTGRISRPLPPTASTDAVYDAGAFQILKPPLATGEGRQEVAVYCNTCHSPMYITMQPALPADTWAAEVAKMQKTYGADIPDEVAKKIVRYLQSNYTPETRRR